MLFRMLIKIVFSSCKFNRMIGECVISIFV